MSDLNNNTLRFKVRKWIEIAIRTDPANLKKWERFLLVSAMCFVIVAITLGFVLYILLL